jgi:MraZ protein
MFLGEYDHSIDQKGRVAIPARFRDQFKEGIILSRGFDRCIIAYTVSIWRKLVDSLESLPTTPSRNRFLVRTTFANAFDQELDRQGRVVLPPALREYAQIKDGAVIAGINSYLEIWDKEQWLAQKALMDEQAWQLAERIEDRK